MRTIPFLLLTLALTCAQLAAQKPTAPAARKPGRILFDFRVTQPLSKPIPVATQNSVLAKVFRRYLDDESKCNPNFAGGNGDDPLKAARNAGQIVPSIMDMATGSFTAAGQTQTVYVISVSECNASHAENFGSKRVAIFAGQQLVVDLDVDYKSSIVRKTDLNGDGIDELLMTSSDMHQGVSSEIAALLEFQSKRLRVIEDLGLVNEDSCASAIPGSNSKASVISISEAMPGQMPALKMENYRASCRTPNRWRFFSTGKMEGQE